MKFACGSCGKRFASVDEPVAGRSYRLRCRCGNIIRISVRQPEVEGTGPPNVLSLPAGPRITGGALTQATGATRTAVALGRMASPAPVPDPLATMTFSLEESPRRQARAISSDDDAGSIDLSLTGQYAMPAPRVSREVRMLAAVGMILALAIGAAAGALLWKLREGGALGPRDVRGSVEARAPEDMVARAPVDVEARVPANEERASTPPASQGPSAPGARGSPVPASAEASPGPAPSGSSIRGTGSETPRASGARGISGAPAIERGEDSRALSETKIERREDRRVLSETKSEDLPGPPTRVDERRSAGYASARPPDMVQQIQRPKGAASPAPLAQEKVPQPMAVPAPVPVPEEETRRERPQARSVETRAAAANGEPEGLDPAIMRSVIGRSRPGFDLCVSRALADPATSAFVGQKAALLILVSPSGRAEAALENGDLDSSPFGACLRREVARMTFPQFKGKEVGARITLVLGRAE